MTTELNQEAVTDIAWRDEIWRLRSLLAESEKRGADYLIRAVRAERRVRELVGRPDEAHSTHPGWPRCCDKWQAGAR